VSGVGAGAAGRGGDGRGGLRRGGSAGGGGRRDIRAGRRRLWAACLEGEDLLCLERGEIEPAAVLGRRVGERLGAVAFAARQQGRRRERHLRRGRRRHGGWRLGHGGWWRRHGGWQREHSG
jgi:hypothetical protein